MKRALHFVLLTLGLLSAIEASAAAKKQSKPPRKKPAAVHVYKADAGPAIAASPRLTPERNRMGTRPRADGELVAAPGPGSAGSPTEGSMRRAVGSPQLDLRFLPQVPLVRRERPEREDPLIVPVTVEGKIVPPNRNNTAAPPAPSAPSPSPSVSFSGLDFATWGSGHPPDTVGDVGPNHYIQAVNASVGIFSKSGGAPLAAFNFNVLMSQGHFGNLCDTNNFGDPVVLYDTFEDRWILTDFAFQLDANDDIPNPPGAFQCFAVSKSGDPISGGWNFYSLQITDKANDYPKLGIWPDGIYMSANMFSFRAVGPFEGTRVWALNKAQMYAGAPSVQVVQFDPPSYEFTLLPSHARLQAGTPPAGSPNYFATVGSFTDQLSTYKFHVDWTRISLSTLTGPFVTTTPTSWVSAPSRAPAKNGENNDTLATRLMMQNQYTNIGGVESLWQTHTVRNPSTPGVAAVRYYQTNVTAGSIAANTAQAFTHAPDTTNRYMPSLAIDRAGNMALGYSASSAALFPAIRYAGRLATDPLDSLPQTETSLIEGTGSQTGGFNRWGDYSAMSLDPDGCTFWYTNEYFAATGGNWQTRVGSFNYGSPSCLPIATGTVSGTVTATAGGGPVVGAAVSLGSRTATTNGSGAYSFLSVPSGTYPGMAVTSPGYNTGSATVIVVTDSNTTTQNFSLTAAPASGCPVDTDAADFQTGVPTNTDLTSNPGAVILNNPLVVDQFNTGGTNIGNDVDTVNWGGQTFTAGLTGPLARADVAILCSICSGTFPDLTLSLRATSGGLPTGPDLATATLHGINSSATTYLTGIFATPATVAAGTTYALVVRPVANPSAGTYKIPFSNAYPNGQPLSSTDSGSTWTAANNDYGFLTYVKIGYASSGDFVSTRKDANPAPGLTPIWSTLSWTATVPASTSVQFQVAGSNSANGPFNFVGPDGTAATFFTTSGASLSQFYGFRYLKYKAYLSTSDTAQTPVLSDVTICYSVADCSAPIAVTPTPSQVCASSAGNTASGPAGASSYAWSITNGTITGSTASQSVTYTAGAAGSVGLTLNIVEAGGCRRSGSASVTIVTTPAPTVTPGGPTSFCTGGSVTLTSSSAAGNQWFNGVTLLAGETSQTYVATAAGNYNVVVTANSCPSAPSASTAVTVNSIPSAPTITAGGPTTFCAGNSVTLTSSSATGNQWYNGTTLLAGQNGKTYIATASGNYNAVVTTNGCSSPPSSPTAVTVNPLPPAPTITPGGPTTFCTGGSVTLTSSAASGNQWFLNGDAIGGATNQTFAANASGNYTVKATDGNSCTSAASAITAVTVKAIPATPTITPAGSAQFCSAGSKTLTSSSATGNQWYLEGVLLNGATNQTVSADTAGHYTVVVTANGCSSAPSAATNVTINPTPAKPVITAGGPTTFCAGGSVTLNSNSASGNQWYLNGNPITGATNQSFIATASGSYSAIVTTLGCVSSASDPAVVTVNAIPATPTITPSGAAQFCSAGSKTLTSSSATGNQWYLEGVLLNGATNQTVSADTAGHYTVVVTTNGCSSAASAATNVTINPTPAKPAITAGGPVTFCAGGSVTLTSSSASGNQWSLNGNPITGATNQSFIATASGSYSAIVTTLGCISSASDAAVVTVNPLPATPSITPGGPTTFCTGGSVNLTSSSASGNQWFLNGNAITGATNQMFSATATGNYTVKVTNANTCTSAASAAAAVTVSPIPATPTITPGGPASFCTGGSVTLTSSSASGNQWFLNGNAITGATNPTFSATASGSYSVTVTAAGCTSAASAATAITVNPKPNATITAPAGVLTNTTGNGASVANAGAGATYAWSITGGAITAGGATNSITFTAGGPGTLTLNVTVITSAGCSDAKSANVAVALPPVTVTTITPGLGTTAGGSPVTINGSGFVAGAAVSIGGMAATNVVVVSATKITARTPAHAAGSVNVAVTNSDTSAGTLTSGFRFQAIVFDPNADGVIDPADIFFMINYLFTSGQAPHGEAGLLSGDANTDGVIDPADIFFIINFLFLGGHSPSALPQPRAMAVGTEAPSIAGSLSLGTPVLRGGHYFVPVIMTAGPGSIVPQTMSLQIHFDGAVGEAAVRRAGVAKELSPVFEFSRLTGNNLSYLATYDPHGLAFGVSRSATVAEIEIEPGDAMISIGIDPRLTMLGDQTGAMKATVANGNLEVRGTTIGTSGSPRPRPPHPEVN